MTGRRPARPATGGDRTACAFWLYVALLTGLTSAASAALCVLAMP